MVLSPVRLAAAGVFSESREQRKHVALAAGVPVAGPGQVGQVGDGRGHVALVAVVDQLVDEFGGDGGPEADLVHLGQKGLEQLLILPRCCLRKAVLQNVLVWYAVGVKAAQGDHVF